MPSSLSNSRETTGYEPLRAAQTVVAGGGRAVCQRYGVGGFRADLECADVGHAILIVELLLQCSAFRVCITQLKAQGPSRTCNESKEEQAEALSNSCFSVQRLGFLIVKPCIVKLLEELRSSVFTEASVFRV